MEENTTNTIIEEVNENVIEGVTKNNNLRNGIAIGLATVAIGLVGKHLYDKFRAKKNSEDEEEITEEESNEDEE